MCLLCNREIDKGMVCNNCLEYLPVVNSPICRLCGRPIKKGIVCFSCKKPRMLDHGRAWILFIPPSDKLIYHFKYKRKTRLAHLLARAMSGLVLSDHILATADIITSVPLYWWKRLRRGYDQASLLARVMSHETHIEQHSTLKRVRNTRTQTRLNDEQRQQNVRNAFILRANGIEGKKVILVDDVLTTGATMNECARVLKEAGAAAVYSCVAAITP
jgi:ComF family protein